MNLINTIIPVYNSVTCAGGKDFAISRNQGCGNDPRAKVPHRNEAYSISLVLRGRLVKYIDFEKHFIEAPAIISMTPEQVHQFEEIDDCETINISFSKDFLVGEMQGWFACWECMFGHAVVNLDEEALPELMVYADLMLEEFRNDKTRKEFVIRNLLNAFIICCARLRKSNVSVMHMDQSQNKLVMQFKQYVDNYFREKTRVGEYADMLYVTPGHLNDTIKTTVGKTAKQVIDEKRITEAKRLLFWGNHNIKEIAWQLNFDDDAYFNRFFKKHTGQTPSLFQRVIRKKYN